ncbi:MAG: hypothetical protein ABFR62_04555 [Bacteroidota bacterium]
MKKDKGYNKKQTIEALLNSLVFAIPTVIFYLQGNKIMAALSAMASLFNLYTIPLSKSSTKTTLIGASSINIITSLFIILFYFSIKSWLLLLIWVLVIMWYIYNLIKTKIR